MLLEYIWSFIVMIGIFALTYVSVKFLSHKVNVKGRSSVIEVVDSVMIDRETRISVVKVQTQFFVMSHSKTSGSSLVLLDNFIPPQQAVSEPNILFASLLQKFKKEHQKNAE